MSAERIYRYGEDRIDTGRKWRVADNGRPHFQSGVKGGGKGPLRKSPD